MYIENCGMVLEGGGMRGAFTAGIIEFLLKKKFIFKYVIGVSAGANNGANYTSRQVERNKKIFVDLVEDERYMGIKNLIKDGNYFGMDFLFHELPHKILPFDYGNFSKSESKLVVGVTECEEGKTVFFEPQNHSSQKKIDKIFEASSSLPLVSNPVEIDGREYLDGGITAPIPVHKAENDGYKKNIIVLTREKNYRKEPVKAGFLLDFFLKDYPHLADKLKNRYMVYNKTIDYILKKEKKGDFFVFRPKNLGIDRFSKDQEKLKEIYNSGYKIAEDRSKELIDWLKS
ncbi:MAG: patatin-like phospholipase family protein [Bacillota bacterium]